MLQLTPKLVEIYMKFILSKFHFFVLWFLTFFHSSCFNIYFKTCVFYHMETGKEATKYLENFFQKIKFDHESYLIAGIINFSFN